MEAEKRLRLLSLQLRWLNKMVQLTQRQILWALLAQKQSLPVLRLPTAGVVVRVGDR